MKSESITFITEALVGLQGELEGAKKDSTNPFFKSRYADLSSVWAAAREGLKKYKLAVVQLPGKDEFGDYLETILSHISGEFIGSKLYISPVADVKIYAVGDKQEVRSFVTPQAIGSAITYARRYALQSILGICPEDDDGEAAMSRPSAISLTKQSFQAKEVLQGKPKGEKYDPTGKDDIEF